MMPSSRILTITLSVMLLVQAVIADLPSGRYTFRNFMTHGNLVLSSTPQDNPNQPIKVVTDKSSTELWDFILDGDNGYIIKPVARPGFALTHVDSRIYASPEPSSTRWELIDDELRGKNHFVVIDPRVGTGKALEGTVEQDTVFGILSVDKAVPPRYPPHAVWVIEAK